MGKRAWGEGGTLPPSPGRRCPEGAEVGSRRGMKRNARQSFHVSASRAAGSAVLPVIPLLTAFLDRERKRFLAFARNDDAGRRHTPSHTFSLRSSAVFQLFYGNTALFNESFSSSIQKPVIFIAVMPYSDYKHSKRSGDSGARKASMAGILSLCDCKGENNEKT